MRFMILVILVFSALLSGCAAVHYTMLAAADPIDVFVTDDHLRVGACTKVKDVEATTLLAGAFVIELAFMKMTEDMKGQAQAAGANTLLVKSKRVGFWGSSAEGTAYICPAPAPAPAQPPKRE